MARIRARAGLAGLEFAIAAPLLMLLLLATIDVSRAILTARRMEVAAGAIAEMASTAAARAASPNTLSSTAAWQATTAAFAWFPDWARAGGANTFSITLSSINFASTSGGYKPKLAWSVANPLGVSRLRPCGSPAIVANDATPTTASISAGDVGTTSLLVADISTTFQPMFLGLILVTIPMTQSASVSPRIGNGVTLLIDGGAASTVICPQAG